MEVTGPNAVSKWRELLGATDPAVAKSNNPLSVRAKFGLDKTRNAAHGSDSPASAARELEQFFGGPAPSGANAGLAPGLRLASSAELRDSALVLVKPHAVLAGQAGGIVNYLRSPGGFSVTAAAVYFLDKANAEEFLAVYKGTSAGIDEWTLRSASYSASVSAIRKEWNVLETRNGVQALWPSTRSWSMSC